jgi:leucyl aminopeptidase
MKSLSILLSLISFVVATPLSSSSQEQLFFNADGATYPGFNLDLTALRLVEMEGQAPVWVTELEKVCYIFYLIPARWFYFPRSDQVEG